MSAVEIEVLDLPMQAKVVVKTILVVCGPQVIIYGDSTAMSSPTSVACATLKEEKKHSQSRDITEILLVALLPARSFPLHSRGFCSWFSLMLHTNICSNFSNSAAG